MPVWPSRTPTIVLALVVEDNGVGFDRVAALPDSASGLVAMRGARGLGGRLSIEAAWAQERRSWWRCPSTSAVDERPIRASIADDHGLLRAG